MNIPIFFASNEFYIPYVSVMMQSIMENAAKERKYEFYILHKDIKTETMEKLQEQVRIFSDFSLNFVDMSSHIKDYDFFISRHITKEAYFRLFIPYIFPKMEKAFYFDGDMVCLTDISELFNTDISDYLVAATRDTAVSWYYGPEDKNKPNIFPVILNMENPQDYINSGMLFINCEKFRRTSLENTMTILTSITLSVIMAA